MKRSLTLAAMLGLSDLLGAAEPPRDAEGAVKAWLGDQPGGVAVAYVDEDGARFYAAGKFAANDARPVGADTQFEIGSVTKVFTALLLADSVRAGKVALDAPVGAPFAASGITYAQLATHTSGLPRLPKDFRSEDARNPYAEQTLAALEKSFAQAAPRAKPGAVSDYSNFGFAVLGQALAGAWGRPYVTLVEERLLQPLGMSDTVLSWRRADAARLAPGHDGKRVKRNWDMNAYAPAGALVSTPRDLAKFLQACLGLVASPLAPAIADAVQPRAASDEEVTKVGLAWMIARRGDATVIWHNGGTGGYRSFVGFDPAKRVGVAVLTNQAKGVEPLGFSLLAGKGPTPPPKEIAVEEARLADYVGKFRHGAKMVFTVERKDGRLRVQLTGQPFWPVFASAPDEFFYKVVDAQLSFVRGADGKVTAVVLHQNGADLRAERVKE